MNGLSILALVLTTVGLICVSIEAIKSDCGDDVNKIMLSLALVCLIIGLIINVMVTVTRWEVDSLKTDFDSIKYTNRSSDIKAETPEGSEVNLRLFDSFDFNGIPKYVTIDKNIIAPNVILITNNGVKFRLVKQDKDSDTQTMYLLERFTQEEQVKEDVKESDDEVK